MNEVGISTQKPEIRREAEMAYERLDEALRQLKTDRERREATENQRKNAIAEGTVQFARIKFAVIEPIFNELVARLAAEGFYGETIEEQNDVSSPITLNVDLSEDEVFSAQGSEDTQTDTFCIDFYETLH